MMIKITVLKNGPYSHNPCDVPATYYLGGFDSVNEIAKDVASWRKALETEQFGKPGIKFDDHIKIEVLGEVDADFDTINHLHFV
jgi:hypothetical protein